MEKCGMPVKRPILILVTLLLIFIGTLSIAQSPASYTEAPMLTERVNDGELPPIEERLPATPVVVEPLESVGQYGGTIRRVYTGVADWWNLALMGVRGEPLVQADVAGNISPNILEGWEYRDDGAILRVRLREGLKWSDGQPVTIDDIIYDLEARSSGNVALENAGLASVVQVDGIEKIDELTADLPLSEPFPLEFTLPYVPTISPRHYLIQFDPRFDDGSTWEDLEMAWSPSRNSEALVDLPVLSPWRVTEYVEGSRIVAERNPYFWKVDPQGQQLPYIDRVEFRHVESTDSIPALVRTGQIDFQSRHLFLSDFPFYRQSEAEGGFRTAVLSQTNLGPAVHLNYAAENEALRELFRTQEFRVALSLGIDREAISRNLYFGQSKPWGFSPLPASPAYPGDEYGTMHTEHDPERANQILDELGLEDSNGDGIREVDGRPLSIVIDMDQGGGGGPVQVAELIASQWADIGVRAIANSIDRSLILARWEENSHDAFAWNVNGALNPAAFTFAWSTTAPPGFMWGNVGVPLQEWWVSEGADGVEPPEFIKEINAILVEAARTLDSEERAAMLQEATRIHAENLYKIPTTTLVDIAVVNENLVNVPETWTSGIALLAPRSLAPWQFYYRQ